MRRMKDVLIDNLVWIITILIAIGSFVATSAYQGKAIEDNNIEDKSVHSKLAEKISDIEKTCIKLDSIQSDIKDIKDDIKEIKKIILKPAITDKDSYKAIDIARSTP